MTFYPLKKEIMKELPTFKFTLLSHDESFLPTRGTAKSSGWDVKCAVKDGLNVRPGKHVKIPLGIKAFCPEGWWLELRPRSSTFGKKHLNCLYGVIDEDYEGELIFACQYLPDISGMGSDLKLSYGEAIGQIIPVYRQEMIVENVSEKEYNELCQQRNGHRKDGGFGSTSK